MQKLVRPALALFLAFGSLSGPAHAAHVCTPSEAKEVMALIKTAQGVQGACTRALNRKYAPGVVQKACKACAADIRQSKRIDAWIARHPKCAKDSHLSKLHRAEHKWQNAYKALCN